MQMVNKSRLTTCFWLTVVFENEPANEDFEGFCVTQEDKMISSIFTQVKNLSVGSVHQLEEAYTVKMLNTDDAPVVHSLSDGKIAEMVLNTDKHEDDNDCDKTVNTWKNPHGKNVWSVNC